MATIVDGGVDTFNALALGQLHPQTEQFLQTQAAEAMNSPTLSQYGRQFYEQGQSLFQRLAESRAAQYVKAAQRAVRSIWQNNDVRVLTTIAEMQWAPPAMQRWIMAEPTVRQMYHQQRLEGYDGSYQDAYPNDIGEDHYHYRRVMDGVVQFNEGDDEPEWSATTYFDELDPDEAQLEFSEQEDILDTWTNIVAKIREGKEDPTSRWAAEL